MLGDEWITKHEAKMKRFVESYQKLVWGEALSSLPENPNAVISPAEEEMTFWNF